MGKIDFINDKVHLENSDKRQRDSSNLSDEIICLIAELVLKTKELTLHHDGAGRSGFYDHHGKSISDDLLVDYIHETIIDCLILSDFFD